MAIRRIVGFLGVLICLVGLAEVMFPEWARIATDYIVAPTWLRLSGVFGMAMGIVLVIAALKRLVGLRLFVLILGVYSIAVSLVVFVGPALIQDLINALFLYRTPEFQLTMLWISGLMRIAIGAALLYAAAKPPHIETSER